MARSAIPKLLVFLHVVAKQRALQNELTAALPGVEVTAVGRIADFQRSLTAGQDAVLSLPVVLAVHRLLVELQGHRQGASEESYSLVGANRAPEPDGVATVGAIDMLGRIGTTEFVHSLIGNKPKVERVTKVEDLLPLLQMQRADAVLLPTRLLPELAQASRLRLFDRQLARPVGLAAAAKRGVYGPQLLTKLRQLPAAVSKMLGVDQWI